MSSRHLAARCLAPIVTAMLLGVPGAASHEVAEAPLLSTLEGVDLDGRSWVGEKQLGKVVLVDLWATWCAPCLAEIPRLRRLHAAHERDLTIVGVAVDQGDRRSLRSFVRRQDMEWPQLWDGRGLEGDVARRLAATAVPRTALFDRQGHLVGLDLRGEALEAAIGALVAASGVPTGSSLSLRRGALETRSSRAPD